MPQEPSYNRNEKNRDPRFGGRPNSEEPGQPPRKGPKFSIYWIYAIIFAVLIGFQLLQSLFIKYCINRPGLFLSNSESRAMSANMLSSPTEILSRYI